MYQKKGLSVIIEFPIYETSSNINAPKVKENTIEVMGESPQIKGGNDERCGVNNFTLSRDFSLNNLLD